MRHVMGLALAVAMAVVLFVAGSWGYLKLLANPARSGVLSAAGGSLMHDHAVVEGFAVLLVVGLLAGILIVGPTISPLAAGLPGLALLAWTGLYLASARRAVYYIPLKSRVYGAGFEALLFDGVLAMAGLIMIIPLFVPSRWRLRAAAAPSPYAAVGRLSRSGGDPDDGGRRDAGELGRDRDAAAAGSQPGGGALGPRGTWELSSAAGLQLTASRGFTRGSASPGQRSPMARLSAHPR